MSEEKKLNKEKPITKTWWFWFLVAILVLGVICGLGSDTTNVTTTNSTTNTTQEVSAPQETKEEYIAKCEKYKYKDLARNPNSYIGKRVKFTGEVIQVEEGYFNNVVLRMNVTKGEYGFWEDTIYVDYKYADDNESKILEEDIITIYGEFKGQKSYTSVLGAQVTIPQVEAKYVEIKQ